MSLIFRRKRKENKPVKLYLALHSNFNAFDTFIFSSAEVEKTKISLWFSKKLMSSGSEMFNFLIGNVEAN
jgi:hypothetical protein